MLKNVHKMQVHLRRARKEEWEGKREAVRAMKKEWKGEREALRAENEALKEDMNKLEYGVYDMLKLGFVNMDKLKRIRAISDE
jgi:cell division protein FtsB